MQLEDFNDNLRIRPEQRDPLLDKLDQAAAKATAASRRSTQRMEYRADGIPVTIFHPGGSVSNCLVKSRNLSAGGMSFLHGGFLHHNTECRIVLKTVDNRPVIVDANVRSCRLIHRHIHEVGVQFQEKLDPSLFCGSAASVTSKEGGSQVFRVQTPISMLVTTDDSSDLRGLVARLRARGITVLTAPSVGAAGDLIKRLSFGCVLACCRRPGASPLEFAAAVRGFGHSAALVVLAGADDPSIVTGVERAASCMCFACSDLPDSDLDRIVWSLRPSAPRAIVSEAPGGGSSVDYFIEMSRTLSRQLREAAASNDLDAARRACLQIRSTAGGYGFGVIAEVARQAEQSLTGTGRGEIETFSTAEFLAALLLRLRAPKACEVA